MAVFLLVKIFCMKVPLESDILDQSRAEQLIAISTEDTKHVRLQFLKSIHECYLNSFSKQKWVMDIEVALESIWDQITKNVQLVLISPTHRVTKRFILYRACCIG